MKPILATILLLATLSCFAQNNAPQAAGGAFTPQPIVPGGIILPLYAPTSPLLKRERRAFIDGHAQVHVLPIGVAIVSREHAAQDARVDLKRFPRLFSHWPGIWTNGRG